MAQSPAPGALTRLADDYAKALDTLERRSRRNTVTTLRRSLNNVLISLRRSYTLYLDELGPQGFDPSRQPIRRPGEYSAAEATAKFRAIMRDAQQFMTDEELRQWSVAYERDLREAARLGGELGTRLERMLRRPDVEEELERLAAERPSDAEDVGLNDLGGLPPLTVADPEDLEDSET